MAGWARYRLDIAYVGHRFSGFALNRARDQGAATDTVPRKVLPTVAATLASALARMAGEENVRGLAGASRTDAGVHALQNVVFVDVRRVKRARCAPAPASVSVQLRAPSQALASEPEGAHSGSRGDMNAAPEGQQDAAAAAGDSTPRVSGGAAFSHAELHAALHSLLRPTGMEVMRVQRVPDGAHVRRGIRDKTYVYSLAWPTQHAAAPAVAPRTPCPPPFLNPVTLQANTWILPAPLQTDAMCAAARAFVGTHDFSSFRASGCSAHSAVKRLDDVRLVLAPPPPAASALAAPEGCAGGGGTLPTECGLLGSNAAYHDIHAAMGLPRYGLQHAYLVVTGHSFLYHMVRNIVGLLVAVGSGKYEPDVVHRVLAAGSRAAIPYVTAPAHGLTLASIRYEADDTAPGAAAQVLIDAAAHDDAVSVGVPPGELR